MSRELVDAIGTLFTEELWHDRTVEVQSNADSLNMYPALDVNTYGDASALMNSGTGGARDWPLRCRWHGDSASETAPWSCGVCRSTLYPQYDFDKIDPQRTKTTALTRSGLYRMPELLPVGANPVVGNLAGDTPMIRATRLGDELGLEDLWLKLDGYGWPTYSYKDRVVAMALQRAVELGVRRVACVSTGNVGNSVAALAATAGLEAVIFYPEDLEPAKIRMTLAHGASALLVRGCFDDVNALCRQLAIDGTLTFVNLNLRPFYAEGAKTVAFEIAQDLGWTAPDHVVLPAAGAALLTRCARGFRHLARAGLISSQPKIHAAQPEGCSPIATALHNGQPHITPCVPNTYAKSLAIGNPSDGAAALADLRNTHGSAYTAPEQEIREGIDLLARTEGVLTEPAGGTTIATAKALRQQGVLAASDRVVLVITGTGLKTITDDPPTGRATTTSTEPTEFHRAVSTLLEGKP
jgi:threonine synthase